MTKVVETDVLVIGGGGAAARAAIEAHQAGAKITIAVKGGFGSRGLRGTGSTGYARPDYLYFPTPAREVKPAEELEVVYKRIIQAGLGLADRRLVKALVEDGREVRETLEKWGVVHPVIEGTIIHHKGTARRIDPMPGLANIVRGIGEITVLSNTMVTDLLIQNGVCVGAVTIDEREGEPLLIKAGSTILSTGGDAQLYRVNFHPSCVTGDGYAMGYNAGAELMNLEFMQIFPAIGYPTFNNLGWNIWTVNPRILNGNGEEFIQNYLPKRVTVEECMEQHGKHGPFSARDFGKYLEASITKEVKAGRGNEHDACYLDTNALKRLPPKYQQWYSYRGVDLDKEYVELSVGYHCSNGGLRIDENGQTTIPGLYAIGETATGAHGADRLGGGMQAFCQVFGRRAGKHAAAAAKAKGLPTLDNRAAESQLKHIAEFKESKGDQKPAELRKRLQKTAWENLLAVRTKKGITQALKEIGQIRDELMLRLSVVSTWELTQALELENLLQVGELVANAALMRTESRGGHYRDDCPERDDANWTKVITVKKVNGKMQLSPVVIDEEWEDRPDDLGIEWWG